MAIKTKQTRKTPSRKKHSGQHHKHGKNYLKTYWPYIPLLAIIGIGLLANSIWTHQMYNVKGYATKVSPNTLLVATNKSRSNYNGAKLTINAKLNAAAQAKANDMIKHNYWSHVAPDGKQPWQFITSQGYKYQSAGENLAYGFYDSKDVLTAWMHSPEHRANVLNNDYKNVGFGIANSPNYRGNGPETVIVAMYGQPVKPVATTASTNQPQAIPDANTKPQANSQSVTRVQLLSGGAGWSVFLVVLVACTAALIFVLRHGLALKKLMSEGEEFILKHRYLDIAVVALVVLGIILLQTAGTIH